MESDQRSRTTRVTCSRATSTCHEGRPESASVRTTRSIELSGDDVRVLATVGAFRVVPASDLREPNPRTPTRPARDLERLRDLGLVQHDSVRRRADADDPGDAHRARPRRARRSATARRGGDRQAFYVGITKPRELAHDSRVYSAYMKAAERLAERGEPVRRVVLEEELKREYQRFLQAENRARRERGETPEERGRGGGPMGSGARSCRTTTGTFSSRMRGSSTRTAMAAAPSRTSRSSRRTTAAPTRRPRLRAGFTRYRAVGARLGGLRTTGRSGRGVDPRLAEELLS